MGGNESEACQCAKHDRKAENVLSRPTNERVAATAAGRFVDAPSDTPPIASGSKQPNEARAPPLLGYSIWTFEGLARAQIQSRRPLCEISQNW